MIKKSPPFGSASSTISRRVYENEFTRFSTYAEEIQRFGMSLRCKGVLGFVLDRNFDLCDSQPFCLC